MPQGRPVGLRCRSIVQTWQTLECTRHDTLRCNTPSNLKTKHTLKSTPSHQFTLDAGFAARFHGVGDGIRQDVVYDCRCDRVALRSRSRRITPLRHGGQVITFCVVLANVVSANQDSPGELSWLTLPSQSGYRIQDCLSQSEP